MIKLTVLVKRNPALPIEEFHEEWRAHGRMIADEPAFRRYIRRYRKCLARKRVQNPPAVQAPSTPAPPAVTQPAGPIYLPSVFPNPNGYRSGAGCQPGYEQSYIAAGFSCQYAGYNHYIFSPTGPIWTPVYLLFGIWYCADGQFRFRC